MGKVQNILSKDIVIISEEISLCNHVNMNVGPRSLLKCF